MIEKDEKPQVKRIENREDYMDMLLEADPSKASIMRYLKDSDVYGLKLNDDIITLAVILHIDNKTLELKNLVTKKEYRNKGYASALLNFVFDRYKENYKTVILGTGENEKTLRFYLLLTFWVKPRSSAVITPKARFCTIKKISDIVKKVPLELYHRF